MHGEACTWDRLTDILITHGHIDHFGGLPFVRGKSQAPVSVHRYDLRVLTDYERRLNEMARRLRSFLVRAGVEGDEAEGLMDMYLFTKTLYTSQRVDSTFGLQETTSGALQILHVPGHCPGQVVIQVGELLLTSDHVLPSITPHMAPASLARHTGLATYLDSLRRLEDWSAAKGPALGGHGPPMPGWRDRIAEIRRHHDGRLAAIADLLSLPRTIADIATSLFPSAAGYHRLLALEEAGAHVEYLEKRGRIRRATSGKAEKAVRYVQTPTTPSARHAPTTHITTAG
jgi:glyoxylase-like metal-dependent hydrolase (beta-lactamase superfamily II)